MSLPPIRLALIGDPVEHSRSPALHHRFMAEAGVTGSYEAIRVSRVQLPEMLARLAFKGYLGVNVTTPLKEEVLKLSIRVDDIAASIGAANTLIHSAAAGWTATNTDGIGAREAMETALDTPLRDVKILVLGTGATGRAAAQAFVAAGAVTYIWSRTIDRGKAMAERLGGRAWIPGFGVDAIFAALPPSPWVSPDLLALIPRVPVFVDANYGERSTLGAQLGREIITGERMLEAQARESFRIWHQVAQASAQ